MFAPSDVITVWVALDDMDDEIGPLRYVRGSHKWGDGRVGSAGSFFQSDGGLHLLRSAAQREFGGGSKNGDGDGKDNRNDGNDDEGISESQMESVLQIVSLAGLRAGGISIHNGKTWHGSAKNTSLDRPRRGLGMHYVPADVRFTKEARHSQLWRNYVPADVGDEELMKAELSEEDFPIAWKGTEVEDVR